ncbi:MAG: ECF transporter S component, partial [Oscillospiraceae bacterium]|nr:ECF transporter S component [Oscillospiraceae bacterium]
MQKPSLKKYRTKAAFVFVCLLFPLALWIFMATGAKSYGFISMVMVILAMVPFLMLYEMKKPQAREWIPLAVMAAIAAVGRAAFAFVPHFKPTSAIIVITAMVFGPEAGFLT